MLQLSEMVNRTIININTHFFLIHLPDAMLTLGITLFYFQLGLFLKKNRRKWQHEEKFIK